MATYPSVSVSVDASSNFINVSLPSDAQDTRPMLSFTCLKSSFFSSTIDYTISKDASNIITGMQAIAKSNVSATHIASRSALLSSTTWINSAPGVLDVSFNFNNTGERTFRFDASNAVTLCTAAGQLRLGYHILMIATHAFSVIRPSSINAVFTTAQLNACAASIESTIGTAIANMLDTQAGQQAILQKLLDSQGPFFNDTSGSITYNSSMITLNFSALIDNIKINIATPNVKTLVLRNLRVSIQLV